MAFKMKGFSGFGNSPMKQVTIKPLVNKRFKKKKIKTDKTTKEQVSQKTALEGLAEGSKDILKSTRTVNPDGYIIDGYGNKITKTNKTTELKTTELDKPKKQPVRNKRRDIIVTGP